MKIGRFLAHASLVSLALVLTACGGGGGNGGGGGVGSTPNPVTYKKFDELTGDQTFQSAGVSYPLSGIGGSFTRPMGQGVVARYFVSSDDIEVSVPGGGATVRFTAADYQSGSSTDSIDYFAKSDGTGYSLAIEAPKLNGVTLSYTRVGSFFNPGAANGEIAVFGVPTISTDMPTKGSANYSTGMKGALYNSNNVYDLSSSTTTLTANFDSGTIQTSITMNGVPFQGGGAATSLGTLNGSGTIAANAGFSGTFSGANSGGFAGAFFGPQASEMGYAFSVMKDDFHALGFVAGKKN